MRLRKMAECVVMTCAAFVAHAEVKGLQEPWLKSGETLLCFGDSLTAQGGYVSILSNELAAAGVRVVNGGKSGDKTPTALARLARTVEAVQPDAMLLFFGANDAVIGRAQWRDEPKIAPETYRDNLEWIVHYCRMNTGVRKFSIAPPTGGIEGPNGYPFGEIRRNYCLMAREAADQSDAVFVPLDSAFECERMRRMEDAKGLKLTSDGIHLNAEGNRIAAETMLRAWRMK